MSGWTYNLRVGRTPGGNEVLPSQSASNGWRRLPAPGNCGQLAWHTLTNLAPGTYYWSVQAIDAGLAGSSFAPGHSFAFTNFPPTGMFSVTTPEDSSLILLPASLTNAAGQAFTFTILTVPAHGTILTEANGQIWYRAETNFFGNNPIHDRCLIQSSSCRDLSLYKVSTIAGSFPLERKRPT